MAQGRLKMKNLSLRSFKQVTDGFAGSGRYKFEKIKNLKDLRTFFYEYSLFIGDLASIPGMPNFSTANKMRHFFLKSARIMGDANSLMGTAQKMMDGFHMSDLETAGERAFRRVGGRMTGKAMMTIPGTNPLSRAARSGLGANLQKNFDSYTKRLFRQTGLASKPAVRVYGHTNIASLYDHSAIHKLLELVTEDIARQAYIFTPVKTGRLRSTLYPSFQDTKVKGGFIRRGRVSIGEGLDYGLKIEFGSGSGFDVGVGAVKARYFPETPKEVQYLRGAKENRRAVTNGKGAMLRRGFAKAAARVKLSGLGQFKRYDIKKVISDMEGTVKK